MIGYRFVVALVSIAFLAPAPSGQKPADIVLVELAGAAKLELADVQEPAISYPLTVENRGSAEAKKVEVRVTPLASAGGDSAPTTLTAPGQAGPAVTFSLPAGKAVALRLDATLPKAATYQAVIRIVFGTTVLPIPVSIVRTRAKQPIEIGDLPAQQATAGYPRSSLSQAFQATAYSTGGTVVLQPPVLESATRKPKSDSTAGVATGLKLAAGEPVTVTSGLPARIPFTISNLGGPGRYDATIRFPAEGHEPIEKTVTVYVRDSFWLAVAWIALGALLSLFLHAYVAKIRPRLAVQQRVSMLFADLAALQSRHQGDAVASELIEQVRKNIAALWDGLRSKRRAPADADFDLFDTIVRNLHPWTELRRQLLDVRPASIRDKLMPTLDTAAAAFARSSPDATEIQTAVKELEGLPEKIRAEVVSAMRTQVQSFDKELAADPRPEVQAIRGKLPHVLRQLDEGDVKAALAAFSPMRGDYVRLLASELKARTAPPTPPAGVTAEDWEELKAATAAALEKLATIGDPEGEMQAFRAALKNYLEVILTGLGVMSTKVPPGDRATFARKVKAIKARIDAGELTAAWSDLEAVEKEIRAKIGAGAMGAADAVDALSAAAAASSATGALDVIDIVDAAPPSEDLQRAGAAAWVERRIGLFDVLLTAVVIVVAAIIGLQTLWIDNPTWGGWPSYLAAFVWGFALDQFTYAGVLALRRTA